MKIFKNNILNSKEAKIKKGLKLPKASVNLGYYSAEDISPANSLTVVDTSLSIQENYIQNINDQTTLIANELGILEDPSTGNNRFSSEDIFISEYRNSTINTTDYVDVEKVNSFSSGPNSRTDFLYSYYVSRYFTVQEDAKSTSIDQFKYAGKTIYNIVKTSDLQEASRKIQGIDINDIYVTYSDGLEYLDPTGKKKYRIILEKYTDKFVSELDSLCRIIVLLEDANPVGLVLNYDKVELNQDLIIVNSTSNYKEVINSVPLYSRESEESLVVDYSSKYDRTYAVKSVEKIEDMFSSGGSFDSRGFNFYVNKKAIPDNRNYEIFNWRIIGKINRSFDYVNRIDQGIVKVGVIKTNTKSDYTDHSKVFNKLNSINNPINIYNYTFENPVSREEAIPLESSEYWNVDIESITHEKTSKFDFLILVANSNTNIYSIIPKLKSFTDNGGCLFIEVEGDLSDSVKSILPAPVPPLVTGEATSVTYNITESSEYSDLNLFSKNQTWDIKTSIFDTGFGVYGKIAETITAFSSSLSTYQYASTDLGPVVIGFKTNTNSGAVSCGNIILNTVAINKKAGADYTPGSTIVSSSSSNSSTIDLVSAAEGPLKYFYNSIIVGLISKYYTTSNSSNSFSTELLVPVLYHATSWKTSWALNGPTIDDNNSYNDILIKNNELDEYTQYGFTKEQNGDLYRKLDDKTVQEIFLKDFSSSIPSDYGQFYSSNDSIVYYLEFTNSSISPKNGTYLPNSISSGIPTPYYTFELKSEDSIQSIFAKTSVMSRPLNLPSDFGSFYIKDRFRNITIDRGNQASITNDTPYHYSYNFKTDWLKVISQETSLDFDLTYDAEFRVKIPITVKTWENVYGIVGWKTLDEPVPIYRQLKFAGDFTKSSVSDVSIPLSKSGKQITNRFFCKEDFINYAANHNPNNKSSLNHFPYTGDIEEGNTFKQYSFDAGDAKAGTYVHYIQWTMKESGYAVSTDGAFGPQTGSALRQFQVKNGLVVVDTQVDSETKSAMAYFWATKKQNKQLAAAKKRIIKYYEGQKKPSIGEKVIRYIDRAIEYADPFSVAETGRLYRITYTGSTKTPTSMRSNIFISLPDALLDRAVNNAVYNIKISTGDAALTVTGIKFYKAQINDSNIARFPQEGGLSRFEGTQRIEANSSGEFVVNFEQPEVNRYKFLALTVQGSKLPARYGRAHGIFINEVAVNYMPDPGERQPDFGYTAEERSVIDLDAYMDLRTNFESKGLNIQNTPKVQKINSPTIFSKPTTVLNFYYVDQNGVEQQFTYTADSPNQIGAGTILNLQSVQQFNIQNGVTDQWGDVTVKLNEASLTVGQTINITNKSVALTGQTPSPTSPYIDYITLTNESQEVGEDKQEISILFDVNVSSLTSSQSYGGETIVPVHRHLYASYLSDDQAKTERVSPINKNSVDYLSGIVCLCDAGGNPVGHPVFSMSPNNDDNVSVNITNIRLLPVDPTSRLDGLVYGFYDLSARKFLGNNISYSEFMERNGPTNIYIAVMATDYDGNTMSEDIDFINFSTIPISVSRVPNKVICPIYSIKFKNKASIEIFKPQNYLDKKTPWHIAVSSGSFVKSLDLEITKIYNTDLTWIKKYATNSTKVKVKAYYDTASYASSGWSKLLGRPYSDIYEEKPILIDSTTIRLRQTPIAAIHEASSDVSYFGSPIKPFVFVYIRKSINDPWTLVKYSDIASFDCSTGILQFKNGIVPGDYNLIKVNYSVESPYRLIKVIDNFDINLNPFLDKENIKFNKPMFFYIIPRSVEIVDQYEKQELYGEIFEEENVVKYTQDAKIFDPSNPRYNPLALLLSTIYIVDKNVVDSFKFNDLRLKGGGLSYNFDSVEILREMPYARSFWDISGPDGFAYANGGYVIVRLPRALKSYVSNDKIYDTISSALTAGVVFDIEDYEGIPWETEISI